MNKNLSRCFPAVLGISFIIMSSTETFAGRFVLSGDLTPVFRLDFFNTIPPEPGNRQFFSNVLDGGQQVAILPTSLNFSSVIRITDFYNSFFGVSAMSLSGVITESSLSGVDLLVLPVPDRSFLASEISAIETFLDGEGIVFAMGDSATTSNVPDSIPRINALLEGVGSTMRLTSQNLDSGNNFATGDEILGHPLTFGVSSFGYGATASVVGGGPLLLTNGGAPFIAVESHPFPEPSSSALLFAGLLGCSTRRRWRRLR